MTAAPRRWSVLLPVLFGLLFTLGACSQDQGNAQPQDDAPVVIPPPGTPNEYLLAVGQLEPNFGGFFLDGGTLNIYLLNADTATQAEKDRVVRSLVRVYGDAELGSYRPAFLKGDYAMVALYAWYRELTGALPPDGISFTDLDEGRNRLAVGVADAGLVPQVQDTLARLEIPASAVIIEEEGYACPAIGWFPVAAEVRDAEGRPAAVGATVTLAKEGYEASTLGFGDPLVIRAGDSEGGTFDVAVSKPYYDGATVAEVEVPTDDCGIGETVTVEVTLTLRPDAPPVRQVVVAPYGIGLGCGYSVRETAHVEADPGVSKEVVWRSADEGVATVSSDGTITARCRDTDGETTVTATSVADPSKRGSLGVSVWPDLGDGRCP